MTRLCVLVVALGHADRQRQKADTAMRQRCVRFDSTEPSPALRPSDGLARSDGVATIMGGVFVFSRGKL
jgi:hypothetical protein